MYKCNKCRKTFQRPVENGFTYPVPFEGREEVKIELECPFCGSDDIYEVREMKQPFQSLFKAVFPC